METVSLFELPHRRARALLATGVTVHLTVDPVEYHGPHLSLHNDRLLAVGMARRLHAELARESGAPLVLASDLEVGVEPCAGVGTRRFRYAEVRRAVLESVRALAELGAKRVVLGTFHGDPLHGLALDAGVRFLEAAGVRAIAPFALFLRALIDLEDPSEYADAFAPIGDPAARARAAARLHEDFHAGFFETSVALALAPDSVDPGYVDVPPCPPIERDRALALASAAARRAGRDALARELALAATAVGWTRLSPFPGYTGEPALASAASGVAFVAHALRRGAPIVRAVLEGEAKAPPPVMPWIAHATLDGRIAPVPPR